MALIEMNVLTRDLQNNCRNWVDVSGRTYGVDAAQNPATGRPYLRPLNVKWQQDLIPYLYSGDRLVLFRPHNTGIGPELRRLLLRTPVITRIGRFTLWRTSGIRREVITDQMRQRR